MYHKFIERKIKIPKPLISHYCQYFHFLQNNLKSQE